MARLTVWRGLPGVEGRKRIAGETRLFPGITAQLRELNGFGIRVTVIRDNSAGYFM